MQMKRYLHILIVISVMCLTPAPASAKLGVSLGADLGFDCYSNLKYADFYPTHFTGNFYVSYAIGEDWHLGAAASRTKIYFVGLGSATGVGHYSIPLYDIGPILSYMVWNGMNRRAGLWLKPSLRYVWGDMYDDTEQCNRLGTYKGYNARFNVCVDYGVLEMQFGYDFSNIELHDVAMKEAWFQRWRLNTLDLSGPNVSVGLNVGL